VVSILSQWPVGGGGVHLLTWAHCRGKVRHPFKAPRPASATPVEATAKVAGKKGLGGTLARFKFKKK